MRIAEEAVGYRASARPTTHDTGARCGSGSVSVIDINEGSINVWRGGFSVTISSQTELELIT